MIIDINILSFLLKKYQISEIVKVTNLSKQTIRNVIRKKTSNENDLNLSMRTLTKLNQFLIKKGIIDA